MKQPRVVGVSTTLCDAVSAMRILGRGGDANDLAGDWTVIFECSVCQTRCEFTASTQEKCLEAAKACACCDVK